MRDDLQCGACLLDLSLYRRSHARHTLGYGAIMAGAFHCGGPGGAWGNDRGRCVLVL